MATPLTPTREAGSYVIADPYDGVPGVAPVEAGSYVIADPYEFGGRIYLDGAIHLS